MLEFLWDLFQELKEIDGVVASIIAGFFTFIVTKYTYHKNVPLDKYEIAYNRVYYPIYSAIMGGNKNSEIIEKCEHYFVKYAKYVDRSTLKAFEYFKENEGKKGYSNFENNIKAMNTKLRIRLGYLEPNIFAMYTYSSPADKKMIRMLLEAMGIYMPALILPYMGNEKYINAVVSVSVICILVLVVEVLGAVVPRIFRCVLKVFSIMMKNVKTLLRKKKKIKF